MGPRLAKGGRSLRGRCYVTIAAKREKKKRRELKKDAFSCHNCSSITVTISRGASPLFSLYGCVNLVHYRISTSVIFHPPISTVIVSGQ